MVTQEPIEEEDSKSQKKRDMSRLREIAETLSHLNNERIASFKDPKLTEALLTIKKITKGNARKRQIQYIAKLISKVDDPTLEQINKIDNPLSDTLQNHQLEIWREKLIVDTESAFAEICAHYPHIDRQTLRQLTQKAIMERNSDNQSMACFKKLYQFLKTLHQEEPRDT